MVESVSRSSVGLGKTMKDAGSIVQFIVERIGQVYERPRMYGGTPEGVDLILHYFHEIWAEILGCRPRLEEVSQTVHSEAGGIAMGFADSQRRRKPHCTEEEIMQLVVLQWKKVDEALGLNP